jgi:hypothetical protein
LASGPERSRMAALQIGPMVKDARFVSDADGTRHAFVRGGTWEACGPAAAVGWGRP